MDDKSEDNPNKPTFLLTVIAVPAILADFYSRGCATETMMLASRSIACTSFKIPHLTHAHLPPQRIENRTLPGLHVGRLVASAPVAAAAVAAAVRRQTPRRDPPPTQRLAVIILYNLSCCVAVKPLL
jgi:hypothetical protein